MTKKEIGLADEEARFDGEVSPKTGEEICKTGKFTQWRLLPRTH